MHIHTHTHSSICTKLKEKLECNDNKIGWYKEKPNRTTVKIQCLKWEIH